jgi:elongation factor G
MAEGMPQCSPVLLEPIMAIEIAVPSEATAKVNGMISQRRGQILGFDARSGWPGWDVVQAHMPESEMQDLIIELRSATAGVGTFSAKFHHLAELTGKLADNVLASRRQAAE